MYFLWKAPSLDVDKYLEGTLSNMFLLPSIIIQKKTLFCDNNLKMLDLQLKPVHVHIKSIEMLGTALVVLV